MIGKKQTSATSSTLGASPKPSTRITSGAITGTGHGLRADHERAQRAAQGGGEVHRDAERGAGDDRGGEPEHDLVGRRPQVGREQRAVLPQRLEHLRGRGQQQRVDAAERGRAPPSRRAARARTSAAITRRPRARSQRALAQLARRARSSRRRGRGSADVQRLDDPPRPRGEQHDAVGEQDRLLDVVRHEQDRARLARQRVGEPALHLQPRERVERAERLVEAEHRPAGEQRAQERDALAHPARQRRGPRALEALEAERGEVLVRARRAPGARDAGDPQRQRRVVERARATAAARRAAASAPPAPAAHRPGVRRAAARRPARAASTCRSRSARRARRSRPARRAATRRAAPAPRRMPCRRRRARRPCARGAYGASASLCIAPSAGITPQVRRVRSSDGPISAGRSPQPP